MIVFSATRRVTYRDTDKMGIVYHGVYLEYFETGRTEWLREMGLPYTRFEEQGILIIVLGANLTFISPARYDDNLTITAIIRETPSVRMKIEYEIRRGDTLLVTGHTLHAFVQRETMRPVRPPKEFLDKLSGSINV